MMPNSGSDLDKARTPVAKHDLHWLPGDAKPYHDPDSPGLRGAHQAVGTGEPQAGERPAAA